jgi:hypothetical protein
MVLDDADEAGRLSDQLVEIARRSLDSVDMILAYLDVVEW